MKKFLSIILIALTVVSLISSIESKKAHKKSHSHKKSHKHQTSLQSMIDYEIKYLNDHQKDHAKNARDFSVKIVFIKGTILNFLTDLGLNDKEKKLALTVPLNYLAQIMNLIKNFARGLAKPETVTDIGALLNPEFKDFDKYCKNVGNVKTAIDNSKKYIHPTKDIKVYGKKKKAAKRRMK